MIDLAPARWIWLPAGRTLPNSFVLFRRVVQLDTLPRTAVGWITADSRYCLTVNGQRVQWGPAPCDPRQMDVDPVDLASFLRAGENVLGVEVLYYGQGEGTYAGGKPGLLARFDITHADGRSETIVSDASWLALLDRAHRPGQYKRWFLRALQEEFDARQHPYGWDAPGFAPDARWLPAHALPGRADKPSICNGAYEYLGSDGADPAQCALRPREIPPLRETSIPAQRLAATGRVRWQRDPLDWFEFRIPGAFEIELDDGGRTTDDSGVATADVLAFEGMLGDEALLLTYEFAEQIVGWPIFTIHAPAGTIVELMTQEAHDPAGPPWLDTHFFAWSRFVCRAGENRFECFDFESLRWLQLHIRQPYGADAEPARVVVSNVAVRRRVFPWPHEPAITIDDPALQRLFDAAINTLHNSAQETAVDGMGRERQQYSGDCGHQLVAVRYAFGETRLPRRVLRTFSEGITSDGFFLDCWPAYDRLARLMQRQTGVAWWGPLLDHGVGFVFDCWQHYWETGDLDAVREPFPRLLRFAAYLAALRRADGLLPVTDLGVPAVWIDHEAYAQQRHKQCAFNLYAAAMLTHALAPLCRAFGADAAPWEQLGAELLAAAQTRFWDASRGLFVNNLPWLAEEAAPRLCDRSLATAILFGQCVGNDVAGSMEALATCPADLGISYPANAIWRLQALCRGGRADVAVADLRARWATMRSVRENNTLQEFWHARPDSGDQWSHCPVAPLNVVFQNIAGITPAAPGFAHVHVRPQLGGIGALALTARTVRGPIRFVAAPVGDVTHVTLTLPPGCDGTLFLPDGAALPLAGGEPFTATLPA